MSELETVDLDGVEIFSTGVWQGKGSADGGDKITKDTLDGWVDTFNKVGSQVKPRLRLTHNKDDSASVTKMASLGWVKNLRRKGNSLVADIKSVPKKVSQLIDAKAFGRFSPGVWTKMNINGEVHENVFEHLALLGSELPANMSLDGFITDMYEIENNEDIISYTNKLGDIKMDDKRIQDLESQIKTYEAKIDEMIKATDDNKAALEKENDDLKASIKKIEFEKKEAEVDGQLREWVNSQKITPAQVDGYKALMLGYTAEDKGDVKEFSARVDIVKSLIEDAPEVKPVLGEQGKKGEVSEKAYSNAKDDEPKDLDTEIKEYMKEHDEKDYVTAYEAVTEAKIYGGIE